MIVKAKIPVELGKVNRNGRVYSKECFCNDDIDQRIKDRRLLVTFGESVIEREGMLDLHKVVGIVTEIACDKTGVSVSMEPTEKGKRLFSTFDEFSMECTPVGNGIIGSNGEVEDYRLKYFSVVPKT